MAGDVSMSPEMFRVLSGLAMAQGIALPEMDRIAPEIDVSKPIRELAMQVGELVRRQEIFRRGSDVVTVDKVNARWEVMTPGKFCGWIEDFAVIKCGSPGAARRVRASLSREEAALIMEQGVFLDRLRPLNGVHEMVLPVRRAGKGAVSEGQASVPERQCSVLSAQCSEGEAEVAEKAASDEDSPLSRWEFLPVGYDEESGIYTTGTLDYPMDWSWEQARTFLDQHGEEYPFAWPMGADGMMQRPGEVATNRSWAVVVASMLGVYLGAGLPPGMPRPMILGMGNQPGTGKSTLVQMILAPVHGRIGENKFPKDEDKLDQELDTAVREGCRYIFLDDMKSSLSSNKLNAFIASGMRSGRVIGKGERFSMPHACQVFVTGKDVKLTPDLQRRSLIYEMFLATEVQGRKFRRVIDAGYLTSRETRRNFLAALCGLVRHGMSMRCAPVQGLATFEQWTGAVGAFTMAAGYTNPLASPELTAGGAEEEDEMRALLVKVASETDWNEEFDRERMAGIARRHELLEDIVGSGEDMDASQMRRWGRKLQTWRGRVLVDAHGRQFQFGKVRQNKGSKYPLTFLSGAKLSEVQAAKASEAQ